MKATLLLVFIAVALVGCVCVFLGTGLIGVTSTPSSEELFSLCSVENEPSVFKEKMVEAVGIEPTQTNTGITKTLRFLGGYAVTYSMSTHRSAPKRRIVVPILCQ